MEDTGKDMPIGRVLPVQTHVERKEAPGMDAADAAKQAADAGKVDQVLAREKERAQIAAEAAASPSGDPILANMSAYRTAAAEEAEAQDRLDEISAGVQALEVQKWTAHRKRITAARVLAQLFSDELAEDAEDMEDGDDGADEGGDVTHHHPQKKTVVV